MVALYDGEIRYTDASLQPLLQAIDRSNTLVVVTSDHGEQFMEHGALGHGSLHGELLRVPLIFSHPALDVAAEEEVISVAAAVDVAPTLLDLVGLDPMPALPGRSLVAALVGEATPSVAFSSSRMRRVQFSLLDDDGHLIEDPANPAFYRLPQDPQEQYNRLDVLRVSTYRDRLKAHQAEMTLRAPTEPVSPDENWRLMLHELGYQD